jgi:protein translocase SecG subunit
MNRYRVRLDAGKFYGYPYVFSRFGNVYVWTPKPTCHRRRGDDTAHHLVAQPLKLGAQVKEPVVVAASGGHRPDYSRWYNCLRSPFLALNVLNHFLFGILLFVSVVFVLITVIFGSKSDAMSGGSSQIRTTYKGKPGFDDAMSKATLILGLVFMGLCLVINVVQQRIK